MINIFSHPICLEELLVEAGRNNIQSNLRPRDKHQRFGVVFSRWLGDVSDWYFSDGRAVYSIIEQINVALVRFEGGTYEARLRNGELEVATTMTPDGIKKFLRSIEKC